VSAHHDSGDVTRVASTPTLPPDTAVGRVALQVTDVARATTFYESALGFRTIDRDGDGALLGDSGGHALLELHAGAASPVRPGTLGLYHFAVLLPDRAALGRLIRHLSDSGIRIGSSDHLVSEAIYLHDLDGLGIEVYADRPRAEWRMRGGELAMATNPLDIEDLLTAAGSARWDALPAGTTIGHVHLHVGELSRARAFYHTQLGLDIMVESYPGALFLSAGGYHHHLGINTWAGPQAMPPLPAAARLLHWELVVPGAAHARAAVTRLAEASNSVVELDADAVWEAHDPWRIALRIRASH
jgi:catechol 2,3-dioxygenase